MFILWRPTAFDIYRKGTVNFFASGKVFWTLGGLYSKLIYEDSNFRPRDNPSRFGI